MNGMEGGEDAFIPFTPFIPLYSYTVTAVPSGAQV